MVTDTEKNYQEWIKKAEEDLISLESLLKHKDGAPSTACFLAQQAAEKFLKALLVYNNQELEKIHDLIKLSNELGSSFPDIKEIQNDLATISRYYIETRYPGDYPEFTWEECLLALGITQKIRSFVLEKID